MSDETVHVCLFPELNRDYSTNGYLTIDIYDHEREIKDRTKVGHLVKAPEDPGWSLWTQITSSYGERADIRVGVYPYVEHALRDLAHIHGQYWSPNR